MASKGLGKGFDALFEETEQAYDAAGSDILGITEEELKNTTEIPIERLHNNPDQPRKNFDEQGLEELTESIRRHGVLSPILINDEGDGKYLIIAGERRFRAAQRAGLKTMPCVIRRYSAREIKEISLIENLQREDLNPIEAAAAMRQLMTDYRLTQDELAERIGKSRPAVANTLRLLNLSPEVTQLVAEGKLSAGHARTLVPLSPEDQLRFANEAIKGGLSVRELEKRVRVYSDSPEKSAEKKEKKRSLASIELKELVERMKYTFRTKVSLIGTDKKGRIYIDYYSKDDLDRISEIMDIIDRQK